MSAPHREPNQPGAGLPNREIEWVTRTRREVYQDNWGLFLLYGIVATGFGVLLLAWPGRTIALVALLTGLMLVVTGSSQVLLAVSPTDVSRGMRWLMAAVGVGSIVASVLCFVAPLQTLTFLSVLVGSWLVLMGFFAVAAEVMAESSEHRVLVVVRGVLEVVVGTIMLATPKHSLVLLVVLLCVWVFGSAVVSVVMALVLRAHKRREHPAG